MMTKGDVDNALIEALQRHAYPLGGALCEYDPIIDEAKNNQFVLIGEVVDVYLQTKRGAATAKRFFKRLLQESSE